MQDDLLTGLNFLGQLAMTVGRFEEAEATIQEALALVGHDGERNPWQGVNRIPDQQFWAVRQSLKAQMLFLVRNRIAQAHARNNGSEAHLDRLLRFADPSNPNVLTIGFARRFATYKRATLLLENLDWLRQMLERGEMLPPEFTRPEVAQVLIEGIAKKKAEQ